MASSGKVFSHLLLVDHCVWLYSEELLLLTGKFLLGKVSRAKKTNVVGDKKEINWNKTLCQSLDESDWVTAVAANSKVCSSLLHCHRHKTAPLDADEREQPKTIL